MKRTLYGIAAGALLLALGCVPRAGANAITGSLTLTGCPGSGCPNATYTFSITNDSATLTINVTGTVGANDNEITAVNLGFLPSKDISGLSVTGPSAGWMAVTAPVNNGGCGKNGTGAFVCASGVVGITKGGSYTWTWDFTALTTTELDSIIGSDTIHIGANYGPHNGQIVSQTTDGMESATPEPGTLLLLGSGLLGLGFSLRRRLVA